MNNYKIKRAIITGATGAIGTALIQELIENNIEVLVICREDSQRKENIPSHSMVTIKYCSLNQLNKLENNTGKIYDIFYHLAWNGTTGDGRNDMYLQNENVKYALDAVKCALKFGCKRFVGAGSQAEYGRFEGKLKCDTPTFPQNGYGISKLCAGQMTREYAHQLGIAHNWVRVLSVYGPNDGPNSMIMSTISKLKNGEIPKYTKAEQIWDYLYSRDAARAFRMVGEKGIDGKIYVLGSGTARPLVEYIEVIKKIVNPSGRVEIGAIPYANNQVMYLCADVEELYKDVGWKSEVTFEDGICITVNNAIK